MNQICPRCGNSINENEKVCLHCGFVFVNQVQNNLDNNDNSTFSNNQNSVFVFNNHEKKRNFKFEHWNFTGILIGIIIGLLIGGIAGTSITSAIYNSKNNIPSEEKTNTVKESIVENASVSEKVPVPQNEVWNTNGQLDDKNKSLILFDEQNIFIKLNKLVYVEGASDLEFWLEIDNQSKSLIEVGFSDTMIDGTSMHLQPRNTKEYKVGSVSSIYRIYLEDLTNSGLTNFKNISCKIFGKFKDSDMLFEKELEIDRSAFIEDGN